LLLPSKENGVGFDCTGYADVAIGHGPNYWVPVELYNGKPALYGHGGFSFHVGHGGSEHRGWLGLLACVE